jgi:hypothetical protein
VDLGQLCGLERRTVRGTGRDTVDHGAGRHDDVCNAAMGALLLASGPDALEIRRRMGGDEPSGPVREAPPEDRVGRFSRNRRLARRSSCMRSKRHLY